MVVERKKTSGHTQETVFLRCSVQRENICLTACIRALTLRRKTHTISRNTGLQFVTLLGARR